MFDWKSDKKETTRKWKKEKLKKWESFLRERERAVDDAEGKCEKLDF